MSLEEFKSKKIRVFRNGDIFTPGKKLVVSTRVYRNFEQVMNAQGTTERPMAMLELTHLAHHSLKRKSNPARSQFLHTLSDEISLVNGAVRRVYNLSNGTPVHSLDDLQDGGLYVATGGEWFRRVPYMVAPTETAVAPPITPGGRERRRTSVRWGGGANVRARFGISRIGDEGKKEKERERGIFGPTSKAYRVVVFQNGEAADPGMKVILNYRNCRTYEQLLRNLTDLLRINVRKLYDAETGHRITNLRQLRDGQNLVAASTEPFKKIAYPIQDLVAAEKEKATKVVEEDVPRVITVFPNGDQYHIGWTITITRRKFPTLQRLFDHLNATVSLVSGRIHKLYTLEGHCIASTDELTQGKSYVAVSGNDHFIRTSYNLNAPLPVHAGPHGLGGQTRVTEHMAGIRK
ncbi:Doublecortin domain-containing protein 2C, partial [Borealophlyctis nickersoniae]